MNQHLQSTYVLHARPFKNTSLILDLLTVESGRMSVIAKGARRVRSPLPAILQPFVPLLAQWGGRSELQTLYKVEAANLPHRLKDKRLFSALYVNELLARLLHRHAGCPDIYGLYETVLLALENENASMTLTLRYFEKQLLQLLGYGLPLNVETTTRKPIAPDAYYRYDVEQGFQAVSAQLAANPTDTIFLGEHLLAFEAEQLTTKAQCEAAKRLMRLALQPLLNHKPVVSRQLFSLEV